MRSAQCWVISFIFALAPTIASSGHLASLPDVHKDNLKLFQGPVTASVVFCQRDMNLSRSRLLGEFAGIRTDKRPWFANGDGGRATKRNISKLLISSSKD